MKLVMTNISELEGFNLKMIKDDVAVDDQEQYSPHAPRNRHFSCLVDC